MTLPLAEHGDVVTCTNGHRVGVIERLTNKPAGIVDDFAVYPDVERYSVDGACADCGAKWWRRTATQPDWHIDGKGWCRTVFAKLVLACSDCGAVPTPDHPHAWCANCRRHTIHKVVDATSLPADPSPCRIATTVAREIEARAVVGLRKYGVTVADSPLSRAEWLQHAYEEACDLAVYLRKLIEMENSK